MNVTIEGTSESRSAAHAERLVVASIEGRPSRHTACTAREQRGSEGAKKKSRVKLLVATALLHLQPGHKHSPSSTQKVHARASFQCRIPLY